MLFTEIQAARLKALPQRSLQKVILTPSNDKIEIRDDRKSDKYM